MGLILVMLALLLGCYAFCAVTGIVCRHVLRPLQSRAGGGGRLATV
jgi:hypothetical protein